MKDTRLDGHTADAVADVVNRHSDLPVAPDISTEIPESIANKPLPFGVYRGTPKKPPATPPATGLAPVV